MEAAAGRLCVVRIDGDGHRRPGDGLASEVGYEDLPGTGWLQANLDRLVGRGGLHDGGEAALFAAGDESHRGGPVGVIETRDELKPPGCVGDRAAELADDGDRCAGDGFAARIDDRAVVARAPFQLYVDGQRLAGNDLEGLGLRPAVLAVEVCHFGPHVLVFTGDQAQTGDAVAVAGAHAAALGLGAVHARAEALDGLAGLGIAGANLDDLAGGELHLGLGCLASRSVRAGRRSRPGRCPVQRGGQEDGDASRGKVGPADVSRLAGQGCSDDLVGHGPRVAHQHDAGDGLAGGLGDHGYLEGGGLRHLKLDISLPGWVTVLLRADGVEFAVPGRGHLEVDRFTHGDIPEAEGPLRIGPRGQRGDHGAEVQALVMGLAHADGDARTGDRLALVVDDAAGHLPRRGHRHDDGRAGLEVAPARQAEAAARARGYEVDLLRVARHAEAERAVNPGSLPADLVKHVLPEHVLGSGRKGRDERPLQGSAVRVGHAAVQVPRGRERPQRAGAVCG